MNKSHSLGKWTSMSDCIASNRIPLCIYYPMGQHLLKVNVLPTAEIGELNRVTPNFSSYVPFSYIFLCKGAILRENHTFEFYKLSPNDVILSIPCKQDHRDLQLWTARSLDTEVLNERVTSINSPMASKELSRIRDLQMTRMERRPRTFRKMAESCKKSIQRVSAPAKKTEIVLCEPLLSPSDAPLPVLW